MTLPTPIAFEVFQSVDELFDRRTALEQTQHIPDMDAFATDWLKLARDFDAAGLLSNAALCRSRGEHYAKIAAQKPGEYVILIDHPFSEVIEVE